MFTIMRCVGGVQSQLATQEVLLIDEAFDARHQADAAAAGQSVHRSPEGWRVMFVNIVVQAIGSGMSLFHDLPSDGATTRLRKIDIRARPTITPTARVPP
jgi:hypothetical protein